jgi:hypothetical protein
MVYQVLSLEDRYTLILGSSEGSSRNLCLKGIITLWSSEIHLRQSFSSQFYSSFAFYKQRQIEFLTLKRIFVDSNYLLEKLELSIRHQLITIPLQQQVLAFTKLKNNFSFDWAWLLSCLWQLHPLPASLKLGQQIYCESVSNVCQWLVLHSYSSMRASESKKFMDTE